MELSERSSYQEHFRDLCRMLGQPTPTDVDPKGEFYTFEKGVEKSGGGAEEAHAHEPVQPAPDVADKRPRRPGPGRVRGLRLVLRPRGRRGVEEPPRAQPGEKLLKGRSPAYYWHHARGVGPSSCCGPTCVTHRVENKTSRLLGGWGQGGSQTREASAPLHALLSSTYGPCPGHRGGGDHTRKAGYVAGGRPSPMSIPRTPIGPPRSRPPPIRRRAPPGRDGPISRTSSPSSRRPEACSRSPSP